MTKHVYECGRDKCPGRSKPHSQGACMDIEIAEEVAGDAELSGDVALGKKIRKSNKTSSAALLGYTQSGKPVHAPTRAGAPDTNDVVKFNKTKAQFPGWTRADFMDAADLFRHAADRARDASEHKRSSDLHRWTSVFWDIGGRWTGPEFDAYIKSR